MKSRVNNIPIFTFDISSTPLSSVPDLNHLPPTALFYFVPNLNILDHKEPYKTITRLRSKVLKLGNMSGNDI